MKIKGKEVKRLKKKKSARIGFILTIIFGFIGIHQFYYRHYVRGACYLLFCWTYVPILLAIFDLFFVLKWTRKLNAEIEMVNKNQKGSNHDDFFKGSLVEDALINIEQSINQNRIVNYKTLVSTAPAPKYVPPKRLTIQENKKIEENNTLNQRIQVNRIHNKTSNSLGEKEGPIKRLLIDLDNIISNKKINESTLEKEKNRGFSYDRGEVQLVDAATAPDEPIQKVNETNNKDQRTKKIVAPAKEKRETTKKVKGLVNSIKETFEFYNEDDIILMKYRHLKTPQEILDSLEHIKNPKRKSFENGGLTFEIYTSNSHIDFVKESLKNNKISGIDCKHAPFMAYWPTFSHLNKMQTKWYFYWREQVLKENYLDTDLSYIFIFVYELLNYSFNPSASFNVSMLTHLNENYKERQPKLEKYLNPWISDMLNELGYKELSKEWNEQEDYYTPKLYVELGKKDRSLERISMSIWKRYLIGYRGTKFFEQHKHKIYKKFKESIPVLQKCYEEKGTNLTEAWFEQVTDEYPDRTYASAVIGRDRLEVMKKHTTFREKDEMKDVVTNLFRLAENIVREKNGEKRKIKVDESVLPDNMEELILKHTRFKQVITKDQTVMGSKIPLPSKEAKPKEIPKMDLRFDWDIINEKDKELKRIKERIESKELENENTLDSDKPSTDTLNTPTNIPKEKEEALEVKKGTVEKVKPKAFEDVFTSDGDEDYEELLEALTENEKEFLGLFEDNKLDKQKANEFAKKQGMMVAVFLSELNEKADEYIGDILLEETPNMIEVIKDYEAITDMLRSERIEN